MDARDELIKKLTSDLKALSLVASIQEISFWIGSTVASVCSAVAGVSIAANLHDSGSGRFFLGTLAVIPAVWAAIDRALGLRRLSAQNYEYASRIEELLIFAQFNPDMQSTELSKAYAGEIRRQGEVFSNYLRSEENQLPKQKQSESE